MAVEDLYEELRVAIRRQSFPRYIYPLTWTFSTIVSGYNAHPEFNDLYDFAVSILPESLNHGRMVLLSIMYLGAGEAPVDMKNWMDAYESLLFPPGVSVLHCPGRNVDQGVFP
jgi:hypothetical protein